MSNLGTLSFDVDLDLSKLKSKIDQQNEAVKQALEGLQVKVATKSVGELAQQIQSELNNHQFAIKLDEAKLSGLKSDIVSIADKSKEIADNFARMGQGGGGTQQAVNIDLSKFNGISEIIEKIEGEMKRLYNVFADTTDGSGKKVAGLITNLSLLKDALEQLGTAAKNFTPTQQLNEAATAAQNVATATQNAAKSTKTASDEATEATKKQNIETERQYKLQAQVNDLLTRVGNLPQNKGISDINTQLTSLYNNLKEIPPTKSLQELSAEFARIKASAKDMLAAETAMNTVRNAIKLMNEQIDSGNGSQKLEALRKKLVEVITEMNALGKEGNYAKILDIFKGEQGMSNGAQNVIRQMVTEMKKLGVATQETAGITSHLSAEEQKLAQSIQQSTNSMRGQSQILSDLKTMAMQYLSVWGAQSFIHNIIQTGGLLEQQRMSIGAILGDLSQANHLFGQIQQLALKSPFGVVQLDTMSKQLTAYNFKYSELYDWTKRLADISAATGTEVSRLSLALGHVRSEGALSGYTLRQFAMGNVPLLQTLAQQLGKTTSEIRKMTREKAITYDDVEKALRTLTDEGGIFFNAQEVMSNALNAKFKNMYDAFDIMFGKMAESGVGDVLKKVAETMTVLAKNWQETGAVILSVAGYLAVHKAAMMVNTKALLAGNVATGQFTAKQLELQASSGALTKQMLLQAVATGKVEVATVEAAGAVHGLTVAQLEHVKATGKVSAAYNLGTIATSKYTVAQLRAMVETKKVSVLGPLLARLQAGWISLGNAAKLAAGAVGGFVKAFWPMLAISAVVEVVTHLIKKSDEAKDRVKDLLQTADEGFKNLEKDTINFKVGASLGMDKKQLEEAIKEMDEALKNYLPNTGRGVLNDAFKIDPETGTYVNDLAKQYELLANELEVARDAYKKMADISGILEEANDKTGASWSNWTDSFRGNTKDYIDALKEREKAEVDFVSNNKREVEDALAKTRDAYYAYGEEVRHQIELYKSSEGKEGFAPTNLKAQVALLRNYTDAWNVFYNQAYLGSHQLAEGWSDYVDEVDNVKIAHRRMSDDLSVFIESAKGKYEAAFGLPVEKWTRAHQLAVQKDIELFMTSIDGYSSMAEDERMQLERELLQPLSIPMDVDAREANKALTEMQAYLEGLVGHNWVVTLKLQTVGSFEQLYDQLDKDVRDGMATMKKLGTEFTEKRRKELQNMAIDTKTLTGSEKEYAEAYQKTEKAKETAAEKNWKLSSLEKQNAKDKKKEETAANKAQREAINNIKEQIEEVKKFYAEYKKYSKVYGEEKGQSMVEELFGIDHQRANEIISDYKGMLETLAKQLEANKDKKGALSVRQFIAELDLNDAKEIAESTLNKLGKELEAQAKRWDLYKKILDATGNKEQASTIAFGKLINFDNFGQDLRDQITKALESVPKAKGKSIDELLDMDSKQLEKLDIFKDSTNNIYNLLEKLRDAEQSLKAEEVDLFLDALNNAKSLETELEKITTKYQRTRDAINKNENLSQDKKNTLLLNADENETREKANTEWEWFKKNTEGWGEMFGNMDRMTTQAIEDMIQKLEEFIPNVQGSEEAIKAVYEALEKMRNAVHERNPFKAIADSLKEISKYRSAIDAVKKMFPDVKGNETIGLSASIAGNLGLTDGTRGWTGTINQLIASINAAQDTLTKSIGNISNVFNALQNVLQPVVDLFEQLGDTSLTQFFQMGSNAISSAASAASGIGTISNLFKDKNSGIGKFLGDAGPYGAAAAAGLSVISSLIAMHDQALQEEIDASKARVKLIENLSKSLEKSFERTLNALQNVQASEKEKETLRDYAYKYDLATSGGTFDVPLFDIPLEAIYGYISKETKDAIDKALKTGSYYDTKLAELLIQRDEIQKQLNAEKNKKDSDAGAISDYEAQLEDLEDQIENFAIDMAKVLYDIDIKSWASELTDAVVEAWENGEDAAEAYKKKVQDMMKDLLKTILAQRIMEQAFENAGITDLIKNLMTGSTGNLDENAVMQIADALGTASEEGTKAITAILDKMEELGYISKEEAEETAANIDTIKNAFSDLLTDPTQNIEEWGKNFRNSLIQELVKNMLLGEEFEKWAADWNERVTNLWNAYNKGEISKDAFDEGMAGLYQEFDNTANDLTARGKKFYEDLGYVFDEAESEDIFDGLSDSWVSNLMDMSKTAEDWANEVGKMIAEQIIKQMVVPTMIQPLIDNLQDVFKAAMDAATTTDKNGNNSYDWDAVLNNNGLMAALNALREKYPDIQAVVKHIMDALKLDTSNYKFDGFSNLADSILESLTDTESDIEKWAAEMGKNMAEQMAKAYIDSQYGEKIEELNEQWQQALQDNNIERMKEIEEALRSLYAAIGDDQALKDLIERLKTVENPFKDMADDFASSLMDMEQSAEDFANNIAKKLTQEMINKVITEQYQSQIDALGEEWRDALEKGDTAAIERIRQQLIALHEEIGDAVKPLLDAISDLDNQIDYTLENMKSTFVSALMDMTASTQDFADNISKIMAQAFIEKFVLGNAFDERMEEWQKRYEQYLSTDISEEDRRNGLKALRDEIASAGKDYANLSNQILDLFGITASSDQEATMNMSEKITYDQADQLLGINLAQELTLEQILATLKENWTEGTANNSLFDNLDEIAAEANMRSNYHTAMLGNTQANDEQSKLMLATMQNMAAMMQDRQDGILTQMAVANSHLQLIRDYSKNIRDEVILHLGSIDSKLNHLRTL